MKSSSSNLYSLKNLETSLICILTMICFSFLTLFFLSCNLNSKSKQLVGSWKTQEGLALTITKINETTFDVALSRKDGKAISDDKISGKYTYNENDKSLSKEVPFDASDVNSAINTLVPKEYKFILTDDGRLYIGGGAKSVFFTKEN